LCVCIFSLSFLLYKSWAEIGHVYRLHPGNTVLELGYLEINTGNK